MKKLIESTLLNPAWHRRLIYPLVAAVLAYAVFAVPGLALVAAVWLGVSLSFGSVICLGLCLCAYTFWLRGYGPQGQHLKDAMVELIADPGFFYLCAMAAVATTGAWMGYDPDLIGECFEFSQQFWGDRGGEVQP